MKSPPPPSLDSRDRQILDLLEQDAWLGYSELAKRIHLSASAVQRRVERLVENGVILGARARLAPEASRRPVHAFVLVHLIEESAATIRAFTKALARLQDIVEAYYLAGEADVVLVVRTESMEKYAAFVERHLNGHRAVRKYQTLTVLRTLV